MYYFFVVYVTIVSIGRTVYCRRVGLFVNGNWEVSGRKWSWRHRGLSRHLLGGTAENYEQPVRMADDPADILTSQLSNIFGVQSFITPIFDWMSQNARYNCGKNCENCEK